MKFTELKKSIQEDPKGIYLLEGDDAYFLTQGEKMLKDAFVTMPELNFTSYEGDQLKGQALTTLTAALQSFPFMAEKRMVKVVDFYPSESEYENYLKPVFENFPQTTVCVIVNHGGKKGGADLKKKKCVTFVDCNKSDEETVVKWVYLTLKRAGISADMEACTSVAQYCLCDMARVSAEVNKLIQYTGSGGAITQEYVDELVFKDAAYRTYEMTNALARKNYGLFLEISNDLLQKGTDEIALLNSLFSYFRTLLTCLGSSDSDAALATKLKMKEYGVKKTREQARAMGAERITYLLNSAYEKLSFIKNGTLSKENAYTCLISEIFFEYQGEKVI
jgi:DNA polymerase-3 subunit delta